MKLVFQRSNVPNWKRAGILALSVLLPALSAKARLTRDEFHGDGSAGRLFTQAGRRDDTVLLVADPAPRAGAPANGSATNRVTITIEGDKRVIRANGWPDHPPGQFPNRGNPNTISPQDYTFRVPLKPPAADKPVSSARSWFGIALNGVPFEPGTAEFWNNDRTWNYEAMSGFINLGLDENRAHVQPSGAYHYHGLPTGLMSRLGGDRKKMLLVGYAADGFPIYTDQGYSDPKSTNSPLKKMRSSYQLKKGERPDGPPGKYDGKFTADYEYVKGSGDLDECNGRLGVTPEYPQGTYHYFITTEFPQLSRLWRGTPDASFQKRGPGGPPGPGFGPRRRGGPGEPKGPPPGPPPV